MAVFLEERGYAIVERNARVGRLEIDIVARKGSVIVFCEVRSRSSVAWGTPAETVTRTKQLRLREAALRWLRANNLPGDIRFDVAGVLIRPNSAPEIAYYEDAF